MCAVWDIYILMLKLAARAYRQAPSCVFCLVCVFVLNLGSYWKCIFIAPINGNRVARLPFVHFPRLKIQEILLVNATERVQKVVQSRGHKIEELAHTHTQWKKHYIGKNVRSCVICFGGKAYIFVAHFLDLLPENCGYLSNKRYTRQCIIKCINF